MKVFGRMVGGIFIIVILICVFGGYVRYDGDSTLWRLFYITYSYLRIIFFFVQIFIFPWAFLIPFAFLIKDISFERLTKKRAAICIGVLSFLIFYNPFFQGLAQFDKLDQQRLQTMLEKAQALELKGRSANEVIALLGKPNSVEKWSSGTVVKGGTCDKGPYQDVTKYEDWEYRVTPFYSLTRIFEVHFTDDKVDHYGEVQYSDDFP